MSDLEYMRQLLLARQARQWGGLRPSTNIEDRRDPANLNAYTPSQWAAALDWSGARPALPDAIGNYYDPANEDARDMVGPRYGSGYGRAPDAVAVALEQMRRSQPRIGFASGGSAFNGLNDQTTGLADRSADTALATSLAEVNAAREAMGMAPLAGPTANPGWSSPYAADAWQGNTPPTFSQEAFDAAWSPLASDYSTDTAYTNTGAGAAPTAYGATGAAPAFSADTYTSAGDIPGTGFVTGGSFGTPAYASGDFTTNANTLTSPYAGQFSADDALAGVPLTGAGDTALTGSVAGFANATGVSPADIMAAQGSIPSLDFSDPGDQATTAVGFAAPASEAAAPAAANASGPVAGLTGMSPGAFAMASGDIPSFSTTDGFGYSAGTNGGYSGTYSASDVGSGSELADAGSDWGGGGGGEWGGGAGGADSGGDGGAGGDGGFGGGGGGDRGGDSGGPNAAGGRILDHALRVAEHYARGGGLGLINPIARAMRPGGRPGYEVGGEVAPLVAAGMARGWDWSPQASAGASGGSGGGGTTPTTTPAASDPAPGGGRYTTGALKIWMPALTGQSTTPQPTASYQPVNTNPDLRIWSALAAAGMNPPAFNLPYGGLGGPYGQ